MMIQTKIMKDILNITNNTHNGINALIISLFSVCIIGFGKELIE